MAHSDTGTPVTLVVGPAQPVPATPPGHDPLPLTGFGLLTLLLLAVVVVMLGSALLAASRRLPAQPARIRTMHSRRTT